MSSPLAAPAVWDGIASAYEAEVLPVFEGFARSALDLAQVPRNSRVVDVACGPGTLAMLAAHAGHTVDAIDFSPRMIERLAARVALLRSNVTPAVGDGQSLSFDAGTFAAGFSLFGLIFFPDRAAGFAELRRVIARGGRAVVTSWPQPAPGSFFATLMGALPKLLAGSGAFPPGPPPVQALATPDTLRAEMSAAFGSVDVQPLREIHKFESVDAAWESMSRTLAPIALLKSKLPPELWAKVDAGMRTEMAPLAAQPFELELQALAGVGVAA